MSTAKNAGAKFSGKGFGIMIRRSHGDDQLAACVGTRPDLPPQLFEQLLEAASETVRAKLVAERRHRVSDVDHVVGDVTNRMHSAANSQPLSYAAAQVLVESMHRAGLLTPAKLEEFASADRFEELVTALSILSNVPTAAIERNMRDTHAQSLLVLAKAVGLSWETTRSIMVLAAKRYRRSTNGIDQVMPAFNRLKRATAQQILDFHRLPSRAARAN